MQKSTPSHIFWPSFKFTVQFVATAVSEDVISSSVSFEAVPVDRAQAITITAAKEVSMAAKSVVDTTSRLMR